MLHVAELCRMHGKHCNSKRQVPSQLTSMLASVLAALHASSACDRPCNPHLACTCIIQAPVCDHQGYVVFLDQKTTKESEHHQPVRR